MYSQRNRIENNTANDNSGGIALMQSRELVVTGNTASHNRGHGILFRDAQYSTIRGNRVEGNGEGMFFFSSLDNDITNNVVVGNQIGARVWAGTERNEVHGNSFIGNAQQVFYVASSDQRWGSNYWSDYLGWDQDADGLGDRPYRNDAFMAQLLHAHPSAVLLLNSPTLEFLTSLQSRLPALRVPTVIDGAPLLTPPPTER
jgi:nitrous oxidase accessory protein